MKKNIFSRLLDIIGTAFMALMVLSVTLQVLSRVVGHPVDWAGEIARYSFVECVLIGAVIATRDKGYIWIDVLYNRMPEKGQLVLTVLITIVSCAFLLMNGYYGLQFTMKQWSIPLSMLPFNSGIVYMFHPICFFLMAVITVYNMAATIRSHLAKEEGGIEC